MFFILAAHEHYSIDVFVAFYISSRLFLYYHSLADSIALGGGDRSRIWQLFPVFSYTEENISGVVPNRYEWPWTAVMRWFRYFHYTFKKLRYLVKPPPIAVSFDPESQSSEKPVVDKLKQKKHSDSSNSSSPYNQVGREAKKEPKSIPNLQEIRCRNTGNKQI